MGKGKSSERGPSRVSVFFKEKWFTFFVAAIPLSLAYFVSLEFIPVDVEPDLDATALSERNFGGGNAEESSDVTQDKNLGENIENSEEKGFIKDAFDILRELKKVILTAQSGDTPTRLIKEWLKENGITGPQNLIDFLSSSNLSISLIIAEDGRVIYFENLEDFNKFFRRIELEGGEGNYLFPEDKIILESEEISN